MQWWGSVTYGNYDVSHIVFGASNDTTVHYDVGQEYTAHHDFGVSSFSNWVSSVVMFGLTVWIFFLPQYTYVDGSNRPTTVFIEGCSIL